MSILPYLTLAGIMLASTSAMADHHKSGGYDKSKGVDKMFERIDADGDGVITREEFTRHSQERFNKMDINNDGKITRDEAQKYREQMREKYKEKRQQNKKTNKE